jgi:aspartyl-tRNA(Asn)/glutamyl-tRNA(Gln) amidotransferase subunit A
MTDPAALSLREIAAALRAGALTAAALTEHAIERHERLGGPLGAYKHWDPEAARVTAEAANAAFAAGADLDPMQGIPVSVKDLFGVRGMPTQAGSPKRLPARFEAEGQVVGALRNQMAVFMGKTHTVEFAFDGVGINPHLGAPCNPWDAAHHRLAGGSSSGAGVSILEGSAYVALGSDSGGSVRMPAAITGTVGLKTTAGRWSLDGIVPFSPSLDSPGLLTRTVEDAALAFAAIDPVCDGVALGRALDAAEVASLQLGLAEAYFWDNCAPGVAEGVRGALAELERAGARIVDIEFPEAAAGQAEGMKGQVVEAEFLANMRAELPEWLETLNPFLVGRLASLESSELLPSADYLANLWAMRRLAVAADARLKTVDAFVCPTVVGTVPKEEDVRTPEAYIAANCLVHQNTYLFNILGLSAITMPIALDKAGMPVGLQIVGRANREERLLTIARACEKVLGTGLERLGTPPLCR